ncbi:MAG: sigma-E processing peptidase SpoIIGA [Clostridia bacterium]|nr:sigma-E processing peptidase SpoIIGA [Clostridia bacterium]
MDFYVDSAVLCGFILNFFCLDTAAGILRVALKKRRLACGALVLSVLGIFCIFDVRIRLLYIPLYMLAVRLIFGRCSGAELVRRYGVCLCSGLMFSAVFLTVIPTSSLVRIISGGGEFFAADDKYFYGLLIIVYGVVKGILFLVSRKKRMFRVRLRIGKETAEAMAMIDTGNSLRDRETGAPVIVAERSLFGDINAKPKEIPFRGVGADGEYIEIYPLDEIYFPEEHRRVHGAYAAFVDRPLSGTGGFRVLLHNSLE